MSECHAFLYAHGLELQVDLTGIIDGFGIALNGFCVLCISQILYHKRESNARGSNMFMYFLVKSVLDTGYFLINIFWIKSLEPTDDWKSLGMAIW
jgi:hypothetical protein